MIALELIITQLYRLWHLAQERGSTLLSCLEPAMVAENASLAIYGAMRGIVAGLAMGRLLNPLV